MDLKERPSIVGYPWLPIPSMAIFGKVEVFDIRSWFLV